MSQLVAARFSDSRSIFGAARFDMFFQIPPEACGGLAGSYRLQECASLRVPATPCCRICQTFAASPAKPGGLPVALVTDKNDHFSNVDFSSTACGAPGALLVAG